MEAIRDEYEDLPLVIIALCIDDEDELDEFFKGAERPPFVVGYAGLEARDELQVRGVPHYFLLDEDRTVLLHARSLTAGEETIRAILDGWDEEE